MRYNKNLFVNNTLRIAITNVCGVEGSRDPSAKYMTLDTARAIASFIREHKIRVREMHITGGEPLLHPQYLEIIKILKEVCYEGVDPDTYLINVDTNATLLTEDIVDELKEAGVCQLSIGVDEYGGSVLNLSGKKINPDATIDTLAYARDEMEITQVHRLIVDDANIENCITFRDRLDIPKSTKDNWGCLSIGNLPLGDSTFARLLRHRYRKERIISDEDGYKWTLTKDIEDYRNNATTYLTEYRAVIQLRKGKCDPALQVTELSPDFTDYKHTEVNYATIDIDGNLNMCHIPNVYKYDKMGDRSEEYTRLDPVNVRQLKVKFTKTVDENGVVVMTPEYKVSTRQKKMSMGDE